MTEQEYDYDNIASDSYDQKKIRSRIERTQKNWKVWAAIPSKFLSAFPSVSSNNAVAPGNSHNMFPPRNFQAQTSLKTFRHVSRSPQTAVFRTDSSEIEVTFTTSSQPKCNQKKNPSGKYAL